MTNEESAPPVESPDDLEQPSAIKSPARKPLVGFQLWGLIGDRPATLQPEQLISRLANAGYDGIEAILSPDLSASRVSELAEENELTVIGVHDLMVTPTVVDHSLSQMVTRANTARSPRIVTMTYHTQPSRTKAEYERLGRALYKAMLHFRREKKILCIHPYAHDLRPLENDSDSGLDVMMKKFNPDEIEIELDLYFADRPGCVGAEEVLRRYSKSIKVLHLNNELSSKGRSREGRRTASVFRGEIPVKERLALALETCDLESVVVEHDAVGAIDIFIDSHDELRDFLS